MNPILAAILSLSAAQGAPDERPRVPEEVFRRPPIVRPSYEVKVQSDPVLPKGDRPEATAPAGDGRLAVSIQPERKSFPGNGPVGITVTLTNKTEKPLRLYGAEKLGRRPELVLVHQKTAGQTRMTGDWDADLKQPPVTLDPGKSYTRTFAILQQAVVAPPGPIPLPRPVPIPLPGPKAGGARDQAAPLEKGGEGGEAPRKGPADRFPAVVVAPPVIAAEGTVRLRLMLEFTAPEAAGRPDAPAWTGRLASDPIDVEFTAPVWVGKPGPPVPGPVTREQAVKIAQQAAEAALSAAYNPQDPVRPAKTGPWIGDAEKTATVKDRPNNAGWTVSWTHTQKGKGHSYHAVIDVDPSGQATVREVFAGYSNR